jgi:uncharacterized protein
MPAPAARMPARLRGIRGRRRRDIAAAGAGRNHAERGAPAVAMPAGHAYIQAMSTAQPTAKPCVICGKPQAEGLSPFCSRRCADVDLHRWLSGVYAVPAEEEDPDDPPADSGPARDTGET